MSTRVIRNHIPRANCRAHKERFGCVLEMFSIPYVLVHQHVGLRPCPEHDTFVFMHWVFEATPTITGKHGEPWGLCLQSNADISFKEKY